MHRNHILCFLVFFLLLAGLTGCELGHPVSQAQTEDNSGKDSILEVEIEEETSSKGTWALQDSLQWISRKDWQAAPPIDSMQTHLPTRITLHHSAVKFVENMQPIKSMQSLQRFSQKASTLGNGHKKQAWADVPYHFVIFPKGQVAEGRRLKYVGDTNTEYDPTEHILINVEGNFEEQEVNAAQLQSLKMLCLYLCREYQIPPDLIATHQDFAKTLCPGKNVVGRVPEIQAFVKARMGK